MKFVINQSLDIKENEIIVNCSVLDVRLKKLIEFIRQYSFSLKGTVDGHTYNIPLEDILYIDSVDGKTFIYCNQKVYDSSETLSSIEQILYHSSFIRISKNCILNLNALKCVRSFLNHRMEVTLKNGEKLIVTRSYINKIKEKLEE